MDLIPFELENDAQQLDTQAQGEPHSIMELDDEASPDDITTVWQPIPMAGQKRQRSPEPEMMETRHGRKVKKHDYSLLHHGRSAQASSDPTSWEEAMSCPEAAQWKVAAKEEFQSLKNTGTIDIIPRSKLPTVIPNSNTQRLINYIWLLSRCKKEDQVF
ncbi:hypothetical protein K3495_g4358 [Podosphaera aphanis]|nr:hypothetical protein K3495_g4358 [Podosphaera aphanis]